ncbi:MAG: hypothetical protein KatS3mg023_3031 [Armatimonadota bacterium]|nr:MAG: hypothetical protein KatS3mg023_3031 [Armatimonadota bacterium]
MGFVTWIIIAGVAFTWFLALVGYASWYQERRGRSGYGRASMFRKPILCLAIANTLLLFSTRNPELRGLAGLFVVVGGMWVLLSAVYLERKSKS